MESVPLSQNAVVAVTTLNEISVEQINQICRYFLQSLVVGSAATKLDDEYESYLGAVSTLMLECARVNAQPDVLRSILKEQAVNEAAAATVGDFYEKHLSTIIAHMSVTGISAANIVGIDWRLDYSVRSKHAGQDNTPLFFLSLKIRDAVTASASGQGSSGTRNVEIVATQEELQDMLGKIKDAVKQVERVVAAAEK